MGSSALWGPGALLRARGLACTQPYGTWWSLSPIDVAWEAAQQWSWWSPQPHEAERLLGLPVSAELSIPTQPSVQI